MKEETAVNKSTFANMRQKFEATNTAAAEHILRTPEKFSDFQIGWAKAFLQRINEEKRRAVLRG
jgi:hypothetical protein